jgi:hypothetical protein
MKVPGFDVFFKLFVSLIVESMSSAIPPNKIGKGLFFISFLKSFTFELLFENSLLLIFIN